MDKSSCSYQSIGGGYLRVKKLLTEHPMINVNTSYFMVKFFLTCKTNFYIFPHKKSVSYFRHIKTGQGPACFHGGTVK